MILRALATALGLALLAGCAEPVFAPEAEVASRAFRAADAPAITLVTAISNRTGQGGHTALIVSGSQRVIFDPAGTWRNPAVPERGDVLYGITPAMLEYYTDYHARPAYHVVMQRLAVSPEQAERALRLVQAHGPANKATCAISVSGILRELGYGEVRRRWYPARVMEDFATVPGVVRTEIHDDTEDAASPGRPPVRAIGDDGFVRAS